MFHGGQASPRHSSGIQGRSYEALGWIRCQWLALGARQAEDPGTIGDLFYVQCQALEDITCGGVVDQILAAIAATLPDD